MGSFEEKLTLQEKCPNTGVFSGPYFPVFSPNTGKYGPEKTPYLHFSRNVTRKIDITFLYVCL